MNPYFLLAFASLCWSGNHIIGRAIAGHVPPIGISTVRWLIPALILYPIARPHIRREWPLINRCLTGHRNRPWFRGKVAGRLCCWLIHVLNLEAEIAAAEERHGVNFETDAANPMFERLTHPSDETYIAAGFPGIMSGATRTPVRAAPRLGAHTDEILAASGA